MMGSLRAAAAAGAVLAAALALVPAVVSSGTGAAAAVTIGQAPPPKLSCGNERPVKPGGGRYTCSFEEEFSGTSLDWTKWYVQDTTVTGFPSGPDGCYLDRPDLISVGNGVLNLTSVLESDPFTCASPYGAFTATKSVSTVTTAGLFAQTQGRFEFRAKFPASTVAGLHAALWLYPQAHTYGAWPNSGEIDVAEFFSGDADQVYPSVHYAGEDPWRSTGFECHLDGAGTQFHRYAVEWTSTTMRFFYDGNLCFSHSWTPSAPLRAPQPFDKPFYLVLTQTFGGDWNAMTPESAKTGTTQVDWVRAWR